MSIIHTQETSLLIQFRLAPTSAVILQKQLRDAGIAYAFSSHQPEPIRGVLRAVVGRNINYHLIPQAETIGLNPLTISHSLQAGMLLETYTRPPGYTPPTHLPKPRTFPYHSSLST